MRKKRYKNVYKNAEERQMETSGDGICLKESYSTGQETRQKNNVCREL